MTVQLEIKRTEKILYNKPYKNGPLFRCKSYLIRIKILFVTFLVILELEKKNRTQPDKGKTEV